MQCPIDNIKLTDNEDKVAFHFCEKCHGMFFTRDELLKCLQAGDVQPQTNVAPETGYDVTQMVVKRHCPACTSTTMVDKILDDIAIDICPSCKGIWLDANELQKIISRHIRKHGDPDKGHDDYWADANSVGDAVKDFLTGAGDWLGDAGSSVGEFFEF